jgi:hypothetical protein
MVLHCNEREHGKGITICGMMGLREILFLERKLNSFFHGALHNFPILYSTLT